MKQIPLFPPDTFQQVRESYLQQEIEKLKLELIKEKEKSVRIIKHQNKVIGALTKNK